MPEYLQISAQVTDFQITGTTTLVTSGLFEGLSAKSLQEGRDLVKAAQELQGSSAKILEGLGAVQQGGTTFGDALAQYANGARELDQGAEALAQGIVGLKSGGTDLSTGAGQLSDKLASAAAAVDSIDTKALEDYATQLEEALPSIQALAADLGATDFESLESQLIAVLDFCEPVLERLRSISWLVRASQDALDGLKGDLDAMRTSIEDLQAQGVDTAELEAYLDSASRSLDDATGFLADIDTSDIDIDTATLRQSIQDLHSLADRLQELLDALGPYESLPQVGDAITQVNELKDGVSALAAGATQLRQGIDLYKAGIDDLVEGAQGLKRGTGTLADSGSDLVSSYDGLAEGIDALQTSYKVFDEEGIHKLDQLASDDLANVFEQMLRLRKLDEHPRSYSGNAEGTAVDVKYIVETAGVM